MRPISSDPAPSPTGSVGSGTHGDALEFAEQLRHRFFDSALARNQRWQQRWPPGRCFGRLDVRGYFAKAFIDPGDERHEERRTERPAASPAARWSFGCLGSKCGVRLHQ